MGTDHNLLLWYAERGGRNEYDKQGRSSVRKKCKCGREWRWRTSGKVNWEGYREKVKKRWICLQRIWCLIRGVGGLQRVGIRFFRVILMKQLGSLCVKYFGAIMKR